MNNIHTEGESSKRFFNTILEVLREKRIINKFSTPFHIFPSGIGAAILKTISGVVQN